MTRQDEDKLVDYLYDELSEDEAQNYLQALSVDSDEIAELEADQAFLDTYREHVLDEEPSAHLDALILAEARQSVEQNQEASFFDRLRTLLLRPATGLVAATAFAGVILVGVGPMMLRGNQPSPALMAEAEVQPQAAAPRAKKPTAPLEENLAVPVDAPAAVEAKEQKLAKSKARAQRAFGVSDGSSGLIAGKKRNEYRRDKAPAKAAAAKDLLADAEQPKAKAEEAELAFADSATPQPPAESEKGLVSEGKVPAQAPRQGDAIGLGGLGRGSGGGGSAIGSLETKGGQGSSPGRRARTNREGGPGSQQRVQELLTSAQTYEAQGNVSAARRSLVRAAQYARPQPQLWARVQLERAELEMRAKKYLEAARYAGKASRVPGFGKAKSARRLEQRAKELAKLKTGG